MTLVDARTQAKIVLKEGVSLSYTKDAAAMRTQILNKLIDWSQTTVSKEAAAGSMVVEYYGTGRSKLLTHDAWYPVEGGTVKFGIDYTAPGIGAGENQQIRASFPTTADYLGCDAVEGTLTVNKAFVRVHVKSASIFYDEKPTTQQYVTTKPAGDFSTAKSGTRMNGTARTRWSMRMVWVNSPPIMPPPRLGTNTNTPVTASRMQATAATP